MASLPAALSPVRGPGPTTPGTGPTTINLQLRWRLSRHARRLCHVALASLALAVATGRPALVSLSAPALVLLFVWRQARPGAAQVTLNLSAGRAYEGEQVAVAVVVSSGKDLGLELVLHPAEAVAAVRAAGRAAASPAVLSFELRRWGRRLPGTVEIIHWDGCRMFEAHNFVPLPPVDCYPVPARHRAALVRGRLGNRVGDHPARSPGDGVEFSGVRQYAAGDRQRSINWAASTRRGRLQVNTFAAERSQDVVVVIDATSDVGDLGSTSVDHAARGALGVARTYLGARDRVGLVFFGEQMRWIAPGLGDRQFFRLVEALLASRAGWSAGNDMARLPRAALPPGAAVVAFSPLLDAKFVEMLRDLRQRGFAVLVVDVLTQAPATARHRLDRLAHSIWRMERQAISFSLAEMGVTVVRWDGEDVLALPLERGARPFSAGRR